MNVFSWWARGNRTLLGDFSSVLTQDRRQPGDASSFGLRDLLNHGFDADRLLSHRPQRLLNGRDHGFQNRDSGVVFGLGGDYAPRRSRVVGRALRCTAPAFVAAQYSAPTGVKAHFARTGNRWL